MKLKRIFTSVSAQFDDLISKVENHEAVAESAIREARQQTAKIHTQLNITAKRLSDLEKRSSQLEEKIQTWKQRAIASNETDRDKALRCMQALKNAQSEADQVHEQIKQTSQLKMELQTHLSDAEQQVLALQGRKESLAARSAKNNVRRYADTVRQESDLESVFNRWEQNLAADEYLSESSSTVNFSSDQLLDQEFIKEEDQNDLEDALNDLLGDQKGKEDQDEQ